MNKALVLDGKALAKELEQEFALRVAAVADKTGIIPTLALILVGDSEENAAYVQMKINACKRVGMRAIRVELPNEYTTEQVIAKIHALNNDMTVSGILLQHPVPKHVDEQLCFDAIALTKDSDGVSTSSFGGMTMMSNAFVNAAPLGIMKLINHYNLDMTGKEAVVIGRSPILGKPIAMLLLNANATVTICHSKTKNLSDIVKRADIVVAAVGKPKFVKADWIKEGAILIDTGYNAGGIGDIDLDHAIEKASAYTPVPGGVGPLTISMLLEQTISAAERKAELNQE